MAEARLFQALSDPTRLKIVGLLAAGPRNVTRIVNLVQAAQPAVSRHLRILREVGLIHDRRLGKEVEYSLDRGRVEEARAWLGDLARAEESGARAAGTVDRSAPDVGARRRVGQPGPSGRRVGGVKHAGDRAKDARSGAPAKGRPKRISPLAARGGVSDVSGPGAGMTGEEPQAPGQARGKTDAVQGDGLAGAGARDRAPRGSKKPRSKARRVKAKGGRSRAKPTAPKRRGKSKAGAVGRETAGRGPDTESVFVVEREEDSMDDFLL
jgi:DNA-binding transcriptional ArsR family regulator